MSHLKPDFQLVLDWISRQWHECCLILLSCVTEWIPTQFNIKYRAICIWTSTPGNWIDNLCKMRPVDTMSSTRLKYVNLSQWYSIFALYVRNSKSLRATDEVFIKECSVHLAEAFSVQAKLLVPKNKLHYPKGERC